MTKRAWLQVIALLIGIAVGFFWQGVWHIIREAWHFIYNSFR